MKKKKLELLSNCAFCGSIPRLIRCGNQKEYLMYQCSKCYQTPVGLSEARVLERTARKIWNKRTKEAEHIIRIYNCVNGEKHD